MPKGRCGMTKADVAIIGAGVVGMACALALLQAGRGVTLFDPAARPDVAGVEHCSDPYDACDGADLLVVATEWPEFADADLDKVADLLSRPSVFDTRAMIDPAAAANAGLILRRPGRRTVHPAQVPAGAL